MATINLAPGTQYLAAIRRRRRNLFMVAGGIVVIVVLVWGGLSLAVVSAQRALAAAQGELSSLERNIAEAGPDVARIALFEERLEAAAKLLTNHKVYTPMLKELERLIPPPTVLTNLTIDSEKAIAEVSGTTPNIDEVAQVLASFESSIARPTMFATTELQSVLRNEIKSAEGGPTTVEYIFRAILSFDGAAVTVR